MGVPSVRRYYLLKRRAALAVGDTLWAGIWRYKQESIPWPALPSVFPARAKLTAAGYATVRDLDDADEQELRALGLTRREAAAVLVAMQEWPMISKVIQGYQEQNGTAVTAWNAPLVSSAARTASGTGETYEVGSGNTLRLTLAVTAASGTTPTLDAIVETSADGATGWRAVFSFGQKTTTGSDRQSFGNLDRFVRCSWTIGGTTPSLTWSLTGELV